MSEILHSLVRGAVALTGWFFFWAAFTAVFVFLPGVLAAVGVYGDSEPIPELIPLFAFGITVVVQSLRFPGKRVVREVFWAIASVVAATAGSVATLWLLFII